MSPVLYFLQPISNHAACAACLLQGLAGPGRGVGAPAPGMMAPRPQVTAAPVMRPPAAAGAPAAGMPPQPGMRPPGGEGTLGRADAAAVVVRSCSCIRAGMPLLQCLRVAAVIAVPVQGVPSSYKQSPSYSTTCCAMPVVGLCGHPPATHYGSSAAVALPNTQACPVCFILQVLPQWVCHPCGQACQGDHLRG